MKNSPFGNFCLKEKRKPFFICSIEISVHQHSSSTIVCNNLQKLWSWFIILPDRTQHWHWKLGLQEEPFGLVSSNYAIDRFQGIELTLKPGSFLRHYQEWIHAETRAVYRIVSI